MRNVPVARVVCVLVCLALLPAVSTAISQTQPDYGGYTGSGNLCLERNYLCTDSHYPIDNGKYIGHDEPSVLFYSKIPGSGNSAIFTVVLPKDPPTLPTQDGTGGTFNFQLHPAFWFGMAMCDTQSAPEFTTTCKRDSDSNIFDSPDPSAPRYIGKHPGTAFLEMQFYPPGWVPGISCDGRRWCAAMTIDSLNTDPNHNIENNHDCRNKVGLEPINFAYITLDGKADSAADPLNSNSLVPNLAHDLLMNPGDTLAVNMHDTRHGFRIVIHDLTSGQTGSMTASKANGFAQINFDPTASTCTSSSYAFHAMYATSSEHTRVPWAVHSYNVAMADEIGHFEYCNAVDPNTGNCTSPGVGESLDEDDTFCFDGSDSTRIQITGCIDEDLDFDGPPYQLQWPGTVPTNDAKLHPQPIEFRSPLFSGPGGQLTNYSRVAFEADLPDIESTCDIFTGKGCVNPPLGAAFYPFFSIRNDKKLGCAWQLGGSLIPGTTNDFGGSSTAEYGPLLSLTFATVGGAGTALADFRRILSKNPCKAS
jgi:hypothetical protein